MHLDKCKICERYPAVYDFGKEGWRIVCLNGCALSIWGDNEKDVVEKWNYENTHRYKERISWFFYKLKTWVKYYLFFKWFNNN